MPPALAKKAGVIGESMAPNTIENRIELPCLPLQILLVVIDDARGAKASYKLDVCCTANRDYLCTHKGCDLHGHRSYATRCTDDQNALPGLQLCFIAQSLQSGKSHAWDHRSFRVA